MIVIAIIAILSIVVILTLNPAQIIMSSRDSNRVSDMATMTSAISLYLAEGGSSLGSSNIVYVSIPDPFATSTAGDQCQGLNLLTLPSGYTYHCVASSTFRSVNGQGWIPINFNSLPAGSPLGNLPIDPTNQSSSRLYYTYDTNGSQYEVTSVMESSKYQLGGSNDVISSDGGTLASVYEKGSAFGLEPLDYGDSSLVGYWPLNEGTGTIAYDDSGNNATGSWNGTQVGTNGYYSAGHGNYAYSGDFDGASDYINAPWQSQLDTSQSWSVSLWANFGSESSTPGLWGLYNTANYTLWMPSTSTLNLYWSTYVTSNYPILMNQWMLLTATRSGSNFSLYKNGALLGTGTNSSVFSSSNILIGLQGRIHTGEYFSGFIDGFRIYNRALTAAQIAAMYASGK